MAQLESVVRGLRSVESAETGEEGSPPPERVGLGWNPDGTWRLSGRLHPERGALIEAALDRLGEAESLNRQDALVRLAEIALAALNDAGPRPLRSHERAAIIIHIDADHIPQPAPEADGGSAEPLTPPKAAARIADGPGLPDRIALKLACDGRVRSVLTMRDPAQRTRILDVGRSRRLATTRQIRVLMIRQNRACAHPGCANHRALEAHHVIHWIHGGLTNLDNLVLLCPRHHHSHHDGRFTITATEHGQFAFAQPDGAALPHTVDIAAATAGSAPIETDHDAIPHNAATTNWDGQRLNRAWAIACLSATRRTPPPSLRLPQPTQPHRPPTGSAA